VKVQRVTASVGQMQLKSLIEAHVVSTLNKTSSCAHRCTEKNKIYFHFISPFMVY
jgi:hypothetical protein